MTDHPEITRLWSDEELDEALRGLHAEVRNSGSVLATARAKVLAAASSKPVSAATDAPSAASADEVSPDTGAAAVPNRQRWVRVALAAGIAAVLVTIGLLIPSFITRHSKPVNTAEAIGALNQAAAAALGATDEPVAPGQYRYIETHAWNTVFSGYNIFQDETLSQVWFRPSRTTPPRTG